MLSPFGIAAKRVSRDQIPVLNLSKRALQALDNAGKEAERLNHNFVCTEHLLIGIVRTGQGGGVKFLQGMGLNLEKLRAELEAWVGRGPDRNRMPNPPYTPRLKKSLALAAKEAKALHHSQVDPDHLLLGLLRDGEGVTARILMRFGVDPECTRHAILTESDPPIGLAEFTGLPQEPESKADWLSRLRRFFFGG